MSAWYFRLLLMLAAIGWGSATTATKYALDGFGPVAMLFVKLVTATVVLWAVLLVRGTRPTGGKGRFAILGFFEPALAYGALTVGLVYTTATNASLLGATESCFVLILAAIFLKERIHGRSVTGLVLALTGVVVLDGLDFGAGFNVGDLLVVTGSLAAAIYVILAARVAPTVDAITMTTYQFTCATAFTLPLMAWLWFTGLEPLPTAVAPRFWTAAMLVGGVCFALSFLLYNHAIRSVPAGLAGLILNMVPVIGVLTAVAFLGEALTPWHVIGGVLVVGGIMLFPATKEEVHDEPWASPGFRENVHTESGHWR